MQAATSAQRRKMQLPALFLYALTKTIHHAAHWTQEGKGHGRQQGTERDSTSTRKPNREKGNRAQGQTRALYGLFSTWTNTNHVWMIPTWTKAIYKWTNPHIAKNAPEGGKQTGEAGGGGRTRRPPSETKTAPAEEEQGHKKGGGATPLYSNGIPLPEQYSTGMDETQAQKRLPMIRPPLR